MRRTVCLFTLLVSWSVVVPGIAQASQGSNPKGSPTISCSTPLRLHDGTNQTGTTVSIFVRGLWVNLSTVSFDNKTSSYTVGACSVELASGSGGTGSFYTHCLAPGCVENVMDSGWNNVISSVYLH
jgi:hypothetical protein